MVKLFEVHMRQVFLTKQVDEFLMHKIHFHYHHIVYHNVVSSHQNTYIHQHTWYHKSYKYNSPNCLSCIKYQNNPASFWIMVPLCIMDSYLSSITFASELVKCFSVCIWSSSCLILECFGLSKLILFPS